MYIRKPSGKLIKSFSLWKHTTALAARRCLLGDGIHSPKNIIIDFDFELRPTECTNLFFQQQTAVVGAIVQL